MDPITSALVGWALPVVADLVKSGGGALFRRWAGVSVDDEIRLMQAQAANLQAVAQLDAPVGSPSQWVIDLRAATRYVATIVMIAGGLAVAFIGVRASSAELADIGLSIAAFPTAFLFGEKFTIKMRGLVK